MSERKYLPTIGQLCDDLVIKLMKSIFDIEHRNDYLADMKLIKEDIWNFFATHDLDRKEDKFIHALIVLALSDREIWLNEAIARKSGKGGRLRYTHSINGIRNKAKNEINKIFRERLDHKIDCLAADLPPDMGNWDVFNDDGSAPNSPG